jgi:hypothetical protein
MAPTAEHTICTYIAGKSYAGTALLFSFPQPSTAIDCGNACASMSDCVAYSFSGGDCALLQTAVGILTVPPESESTVVTGTCSARARAEVRTVAGQRCVLSDNIELPWANLDFSVDTVDAAGCAALCVAVKECLHFNYLGGRCYPKSSTTTIRAVATDQSAVSGICREITTVPSQPPLPVTTLQPTTVMSAPTMPSQTTQLPSTPTSHTISLPPSAQPVDDRLTPLSLSNGSGIDARQWMIIGMALLIAIVISLIVISVLAVRRRQWIAGNTNELDESAEPRFKTIQEPDTISDDGSERLEFDPAGIILDEYLSREYTNYMQQNKSTINTDMPPICFDRPVLTKEVQAIDQTVYEARGSANSQSEFSERVYEYGDVKTGPGGITPVEYSSSANNKRRGPPDSLLPMETSGNPDDVAA